jgi:hypothetical protein
VLSNVTGRARAGTPVLALVLAVTQVLGLTLGCAPPTPVDPAAFAEVAVAPAGRRLDALAGWLAAGRVEAELDGRRGMGRLRMLRLGPRRVRADLELSGAFGLLGSRSILWADGARILWQEGAEPPVRVDADELFSPVLGGPAGGSDLELLLFGLPVLWGRWPTGVTVERKGESHTLRATLAGGATEEAVVAGDPLVLRRLERRDGTGRVVMVARFDRHRTVGGLEAATRIEVRSPSSGNRLRIDWSRVEADPELRPSDSAWPALPAAGGDPRAGTHPPH